MIYTKRDQLAIIELQEERTSFSYEELIQILTKYPSLAVYVELKGLLYGIITLGRIKRAHRSHLGQVGINTEFTAIGPGEFQKAREIFKKERVPEEREKAINFLPVVTSEKKLLGNYTRWDELLSIEYSLSLLQNLNIDDFLRCGFRLVLVRPCAAFPKEQQLFHKLEKILEEKGISIEIIEFSQVLEYSRIADYVLFCTMKEASAAEMLCECLLDCETVQALLVDFQEFVKFLRDDRNRILNMFQEQGVHVLTFDFEENKGEELKRLESELISRRRQKDKNPGNKLRPEERPGFLLELQEYFGNQEMPFLFSTHITPDGTIQLRDAETSFWHIEHGCRRTVGQPTKYERCIYIFGPCFVIGAYVNDENTIASLLQEKVNCSGLKCKVENCGGEPYQLSNLLLKMPLCQGDVVVLDKFLDNYGTKRGMKFVGVQNLNLTEALKGCPSTWFVNSARHCNHKANQVFVDVIYEALFPVLQQPAESRKPIKKGGDPVEQLYLQRYFANFDASVYKTVGSIVMNCNPFTYGHRYLIEEALKQVDFLLIFVVEEDRSLFTFEERFAMVCAGTDDLDHVLVIPSGYFILSSMTFPEYFIKVADEDLEENIENDIILFAEKIAPRLGITHRFVGEELEDMVTNAYNQTMKRILPSYGIQVIEIPRKRNGQRAISASCVRKYLENNNLEQVDILVPDTTKKILFYAND